MGLVQDYYDLYEYYSKKFEKVAVLLQCGPFYELYQDKEEVLGNAKEISRIIHCLWKPKDHRYPDSTHLVGFGVASCDKYTRILKQNGYTCIIVNQVLNGSNEKYDYVINSGDEVRAVTDILAPSTDFDSENLSNHVVYIYLEKYSENHYSIGVAATDILVSNEIFVAEWVTDIGNFDDLYELLLFYKPIETYIISKYEPKLFKWAKWVPLTELDHQSDTVGYSDAINNALKGILVYLKDRLVLHNDFSIKYYESLCSDHLELTCSAIKQLNIDLLIPILNKTQTAMGKRLLESRLKKPFYRIDDILESYDTLTEIDPAFAANLKKILANVPDLDRLIRRLETGNFTRNNFFCLKKVLILLKNDLVHNGMLDDILQHCSIYNDDDDDENDQKFVKGYCTILDCLYQSQASVDSKIKKTLQTAASQLKNVKISSFKIKENLGFVTTNTRAAELKRHFKTWKFTALGKETLVSNEQLLLDLDLSRQTEISIKTREKIVFEKFLLGLCQYLETLKVLSEKLALLDFYQSAYFCNEKYHLVKPEIVEEGLKIDKVRHLVIEKFNNDVQFIPNDLSLITTIGNVIYGVNSSGKSSFLKAVGLAVVMAQAGLFVAAESMQFKPLKRILTRICGKDDIEKGHSSFIVELNEIRSILLKADSDSLSLCDELSKGTETDSAQALNYTLFENMSRKNSKFITTTHLHDIAADLTKFDNIKIFHLKVLFDHDGIAIFERKLHPGPGPRLYGLEIARNMNFPQEFIEKAMEYRKNIFRKSRYNSKHIVTSCKNCQYRPQNDTEIPVEVHHINFQCNADSYGLPIHNSSNLVNLCRECHTSLHLGTLKLTVQQTMKGRKFIFSKGEI